MRNKKTFLLGVALFLLCAGASIRTQASPPAIAGDAVVITNSSRAAQTNRPVSIPRPFVQGEIPNFAQASINGQSLLTQCDVKNRWPDGSLKFAVVSFVIPSLAANGSVTVTFANQTSGNNTGYLQKADMLAAAYNFDGQIQLAGTVSHAISARAILNAAPSCNDPGNDPDGGRYICSYWLKGPLVTAVILEDRTGRGFDVNTDGGMGNPLHPIFEAWFYPQGNSVQLGYTLEDSWASTDPSKSARDQTYSVTLTGGNTNPATKYTNAAFKQIPRSFWHKTFCINACAEAVRVDNNWSYWAQTRFVPHWDTEITLAPSLVASWRNNYAHATTLQGDANGIAGFDKTLDSGGSARWHGPLKTWDAIYLISQDEGVKTEVLNNADLAGRIPYFYREADQRAGHGQHFDAAGTLDTLGRVVSINARTQVSLYDTTLQKCNTNYAPDVINFGAGGQDTDGWEADTTHWPNLAYVAYLSTGQYAYYEEQIMQSAYALGASPGDRPCVEGPTGSHRQGSAGYWYVDEERGNDWTARENALGAFIAVDGSPEKAYLEDKLRANLAVWEGCHNIPNDIGKSYSAAWTYGNTARSGYPLCAGTALGSWTLGTTSYVAESPVPLIQPPSPNAAGAANANFQNGYSAVVIGWINDLGYCPGTCAILQYVANYYINLVLNPAANMYNLGDYVYPTLNHSGHQITSWAENRTFYSLQSKSWPSCADITIDDGYVQTGMAALSYMTKITSSQGGYSGLAAYNAVRKTVGCINTGPAGFDFASGSPKWDITPR
jgi:hypothetical protein